MIAKFWRKVSSKSSFYQLKNSLISANRCNQEPSIIKDWRNYTWDQLDSQSTGGKQEIHNETNRNVSWKIDKSFELKKFANIYSSKMKIHICETISCFLMGWNNVRWIKLYASSCAKGWAPWTMSWLILLSWQPFYGLWKAKTDT